MRKDFLKKPWIIPQPVLMIGTYDDKGNADIMNAAWGGVGDDTQVFLCLSPEHKTTKNILEKGEFTVSIGIEEYLKECDYLGMVSANMDMDKVKKSGFHLEKASFVDAPIILELPLCLECKLISYEAEHCHLFGEIINVSVDESIIENDKPSIEKLKPIVFDILSSSYYSIGEKIGDAFSSGKEIKDK